MKTPLLATAFVLFFALSWVVNLVRFCQTDFKPSYQAEVVRGVGIFVAPVSMVTAWVNLKD